MLALIRARFPARDSETFSSVPFLLDTENCGAKTGYGRLGVDLGHFRLGHFLVRGNCHLSSLRFQRIQLGVRCLHGLGFGFLSLEFWGSGFGVWDLGFVVWCLGFWVWGLGFRVWGLGFRVWGYPGLGLSGDNVTISRHALKTRTQTRFKSVPCSLLSDPPAPVSRQFHSNRGTSLIRNRHPVGPYSRTMPRLLWRSWGGRQFLMSEALVHCMSS